MLLPMGHGKRRSATQRPGYRYLLKHLRQARKAAGLTQVDVAPALGRYQSFVNKTETGERRIDPIELQEFALLYGKRVSWFLPKKHR